jgi:hypothetical protein
MNKDGTADMTVSRTSVGAKYALTAVPTQVECSDSPLP